jgi:hypothetical protein
METTLNILKSSGITLLCLIPFIVIIAVLIVKWGKDIARRERKEEADYNRLYNAIESFLDGNIDISDKREYVREQINNLLSLPHKNTEKSEVLYLKYLDRFGGAGKRPA